VFEDASRKKNRPAGAPPSANKMNCPGQASDQQCRPAGSQTGNKSNGTALGTENTVQARRRQYAS
jgi:hypothetical protein